MIEFNDLRPWQKGFVQKFLTWLEENFLLVALPGGGKTVAALYVMRDWLANAGVKQRYVVVIVPTRNLRRQWQKQAKQKFGLELQSKEFDGQLKFGMHGIVVTYSAIAADPQSFAKFCARHEVFVVFDEPHHMSSADGASWGIASLEAFEAAVRRLFMSGTPWRSDGAKIPFLERDPETGDYIVHTMFDWPLALEEEPLAIRHLVFRPYHGSTEHERDGSVFKISTHDDKSDDDEARCLRGLIMEQLFASDMIRDAHERLVELRQVKPDAAGLAVCMDIGHAQKVAAWLHEVTGVRPHLIVSDDEVSGDTVDIFEKKEGIWVVSVRQVSEGVDVPRFMVGVYLTNYVTELFFRQFVGRVARYQGTDADKEAYIYIPHHVRLVEYSEKIKKLQAIAIRAKQERPDEDQKTGGGGNVESKTVYLGGSNAERGGLIVPGLDKYSPVTEREIAEFARRYGITETAAALILRDRRPSALQQPESNMADVSDPRPLEDILDGKRRLNAKRCRYWATLTGGNHQACETEANRHAGCRSVTTATEEQLNRRLVFIDGKIQEAKNASGA